VEFDAGTRVRIVGDAVLNLARLCFADLTVCARHQQAVAVHGTLPGWIGTPPESGGCV
jgi:hypothetical protein